MAISKYTWHTTSMKDKEVFGYVERVDNGLCICTGTLLTYEEYLELTDFERRKDFRVIAMYDGIMSNQVFMYVADDVLHNAYIVDRRF